MDERKTCLGCQNPLPEGAPGEFCPKCLRQDGPGTVVEETATTAVPPVSEARKLPPPMEGAGSTRTALWPWASAIAAVALLILMGLAAGWLFFRYQALKVVPSASPEQQDLRPGAFEEALWNPGFEAGLEPWGWPGGWWTISTTTDSPHSGQQAAMVLNRTDSWQGIGQSLLGRIEPGRVYHWSAWVRIKNAPEAVVTLHVTKIDDGNRGAMSERLLGSRKVVENEWTEIHGTYVLDDLTGSLSRLFFYLGGPPPGVNLVVDDVSIAPAQTGEAQTRPAQVEPSPTMPPEVRGGMASRWTRDAPRFIPPTVLPKVRGGMARDSQTGTQTTLQQADTNGVFVLKAIEAEIHGQIARYEELKDCIGFWMVREDYVAWTCDVMKPGRFSVALTYACAPGVEGSQYTVGVEAPAVDSEPSEAPDSRITDTVKATGGWSSYLTEAPGEIALPAGHHKIAVRALTIQSAVMNLRELRLSPLP